MPVQTSTLEAAGGRSCDSQQILTANVRYGSKADIATVSVNVRFTPESGHRNSIVECPPVSQVGKLIPAPGNFRGLSIRPRVSHSSTVGWHEMKSRPDSRR